MRNGEQGRGDSPVVSMHTAAGEQLSRSLAHSSWFWQVTPSPENPALQMHMKDPSTFMQTEKRSQFPSPKPHSLRSVQVTPFPVKPVKQAQVKEPSVLEHRP